METFVSVQPLIYYNDYFFFCFFTLIACLSMKNCELFVAFWIFL
jgi:hypothetical protein